MAEAYAVAAEIRARRAGARRAGASGRKIGFTNTTIWPLYGVSAPMWNFIYDSTVHDLAAVAGGFDLRGLAEPRIEPEIVLGPGGGRRRPGMSEEALLGCVDWVAHGFEIVQSVYPGWKLSGAESAAAFGLHGALLIGPRHAIGGDRAGVGRAAAELHADAAQAAAWRWPRAPGANVLGGPIQALRFLVEEIARYPGNAPIAAGEIVTTGTLTDAQPVRPGDAWSTELRGIPIAGIALAFASR